jgi:benzoate-CoA ligase
MTPAASALAPAPETDAGIRAGDGIPRSYNFAADILARNGGRAGKPAFIDPRETLTYGGLATRVERFGNMLRRLGIESEQRVMLSLLDTVDWPVAFLGSLKAGVVPIPVNTLLTEDDYRFMLADSRARALIVSEALYPKFENLITENPDLKHVIVSGANSHGHQRLSDLMASAP